ncbi:MAG: hypothetical protein ACIAS6_13915 [Phycisphaerales bacterium JB060]
MPDHSIRLTQDTNDDSWWSPDDAALSVGKTNQEDNDEPRPIPARRLLYAGVLIFLVTVVTVVFLPDIVAVLTPMGAMVAFGAIVASAVVTAAPKREPPGRQQADGKAVTCGGPRPVGELSRRMAEKRDRENGGCGPGSGGGSCGC